MILNLAKHMRTREMQAKPYNYEKKQSKSKTRKTVKKEQDNKPARKQNAHATKTPNQSPTKKKAGRSAQKSKTRKTNGNSEEGKKTKSTEQQTNSQRKPYNYSIQLFQINPISIKKDHIIIP